MFACFECGATYKNKVRFCSCCFEYNCVIEAPKQSKLFWQTRKREVLTSKELIAKAKRGSAIHGFDFLGELPEKWIMLLYGLPGHGKSTLALKIANALQEETLFFAIEEGQSQSIIKKLIDWEIRNDKILISDANETREIRQDIQEYRPKLIVLDSVTALGSTLTHQKTIWVAQSTKEGSFKGNQALAHDCDIVMKIEDRQAIVEKNRFNDCGVYSLEEIE